MTAASGGGTNFQALLNAISEGRLSAKAAGLIASRPGIGAIERAEKSSVPVSVLEPGAPIAPQFMRCLEMWKPDLLVLAGFTLKIPDEVLEALPDRILNIHPSLLPHYGGKGFYGKRVHEAVLQDNCSESGCTVHLVNEVYDQGRILSQKRVPVKPGDTPETLGNRILAEEHKLYPAVIESYLHTLKSQT